MSLESGAAPATVTAAICNERGVASRHALAGCRSGELGEASYVSLLADIDVLESDAAPDGR
ncbi:MAG: hypothetical protein KF894_28825 [Labilithrix sp.]|nr:hypothetical protein [Labilithrix sp.]